MKKIQAQYVDTVEITDPNSGGQVTLEIYIDPTSGGMFGIDSSFIEQVELEIPSPFNPDEILILDE